MKTLRFHAHGDPAEVLVLDEADIPAPGPGHIRVRVHACGLNPADWVLSTGRFSPELPRGVGLDVSGVVDAVGEGVTGAAIGDKVFGVPAFRDYPSAGAADHAVLSVWAPVPEGLDLVDAAALPMVVETASRCLNILDPSPGSTLFIYGAGTMIGFGAVQMALMRGARVIAAAGETFAAQMRALGAEVTPYGQGMIERVRALAGGAPDLIFDAGPISDVLPALVVLAGGDAHRVVTVSNHGPAAEQLGVRNSFGELAYAALPEFAQLAAEGRFKVPVARAFPLADWRQAFELSCNGQAHGKLVLLPNI
jgi:NADPH:quinone reductase-like Zn-dependent oxidoreductase